MCAGLWDNFIGQFVKIFLWGDDDHEKKKPERSKKQNKQSAYTRAKSEQDPQIPVQSNSAGNSGRTSPSDDAKQAELDLVVKAKAKPGFWPHTHIRVELESALEKLHLKKPGQNAVVSYTAAVRAEQEIITEMQAADFLQHPHAIYLLEVMVAEACSAPVDDVCVTGVIDKLFPKSIFLEDGGILVQYALVVTYKIVVDIVALPSEDAMLKASTVVATALNGGTAGKLYEYLFTIQACISQLEGLSDAQIQLIKVLATAALVQTAEQDSAPVPFRGPSPGGKGEGKGKARVYYWNQNKTVDIAAKYSDQRMFLKHEEEVREIVAAHVAAQRRVKKRRELDERKENRKKEKERERENKENSGDDDEEEDGGEDDYDDDSGSDHSKKKSSSGRSSPIAGTRGTPVALAGLGMEIMRLQGFINPKIMRGENSNF